MAKERVSRWLCTHRDEEEDMKLTSEVAARSLMDPDMGFSKFCLHLRVEG